MSTSVFKSAEGDIITGLVPFSPFEKLITFRTFYHVCFEMKINVVPYTGKVAIFFLYIKIFNAEKNDIHSELWDLEVIRNYRLFLTPEYFFSDCRGGRIRDCKF